MDEHQTTKYRINGTLLSQYQGKNVCLLGCVIQRDSNGMSFKLKASDNQIVVIQMKEPIQDSLEGLVEVQGTVTPRNSVLCDHYVEFPSDSASNFDMNLYNEAVQLMAQYPNYYITF
ncbi:replication protein A 14 kDa subunit-like [Centruroides sculpturatus]|uniref:replication protein A 14 kDa subunit-like n=1 Tax=Centruroides sculpturatus TaxID=218467 RepID=UPI000C6D1685|nr:replication protein A 14 kDa subunit-like [Centruroides sculpturatus]